MFRNILYKILLLLCRCVRLILILHLAAPSWNSNLHAKAWVTACGKTDVARSSHTTWHIWLFSTANSLIFFSSPSRKLSRKPAIIFQSSKMSNPVVTHQPGAGGYGTNVQTGEWSTGLCSCGSDLLVCKCSSKMLQIGIIQILVSHRG